MNCNLADPGPMVLANAEALLRTTPPTTSFTPTPTTIRQTPSHVDLCWLQSHVTPPMDRAFEGLDMLANLTEDIPDFWGVIDPALGLTPDALPLLSGDTPRLPTPFDTGYLHTADSHSMSSTFEPSLFSTHELEEPISPPELAALYCISHILSDENRRLIIDFCPGTKSTLMFFIPFCPF